MVGLLQEGLLNLQERLLRRDRFGPCLDLLAVPANNIRKTKALMTIVVEIVYHDNIRRGDDEEPGELA
jgi:hypothetical protein